MEYPHNLRSILNPDDDGFALLDGPKLASTFGSREPFHSLANPYKTHSTNVVEEALKQVIDEIGVMSAKVMTKLGNQLIYSRECRPKDSKLQLRASRN